MPAVNKIKVTRGTLRKKIEAKIAEAEAEFKLKEAGHAKAVERWRKDIKAFYEKRAKESEKVQLGEHKVAPYNTYRGPLWTDLNEPEYPDTPRLQIGQMQKDLELINISVEDHIVIDIKDSRYGSNPYAKYI